MDLKYLIIWIELGMIAITGIVIIVILIKILVMLKQYIKSVPNFMQNGSTSEGRNSNPHSKHNTNIVAEHSNIEHSRVQSMQDSSIQNHKRQHSQGVQQQYAVTKEQQEAVKYNQSSKHQGEVGVVFCRNCGESFLSTEEACPACKTNRS